MPRVVHVALRWSEAHVSIYHVCLYIYIHNTFVFIHICGLYMCIYVHIPARTAKGGGGSWKFQNRKPIGEVRCWEWKKKTMWIHKWTEKELEFHTSDLSLCLCKCASVESSLLFLSLFLFLFFFFFFSFFFFFFTHDHRIITKWLKTSCFSPNAVATLKGFLRWVSRPGVQSRCSPGPWKGGPAFSL